MEDQLRAGDSREERQVALNTSSDRVFYRLSGMLRRERDPAVRARLVAFSTLFREQAGLESFTFEVFATHPTHQWTLDELEKMAAFQKAHPTWWSQVVEAPFEAMTEAKRGSIKDGDLVNAFDVSVGVLKGVYAFGKGAVEGIYDLVEYGIRFASDEKTRAHALALAKEWAWFCVLLQFGTPEMKAECLKKIQATAQLLISSVKDYFVTEWAKAEKENKTDELIAKWTTQGVLELATLVIGLLKGAKAAKAASSVEKAAAELADAAGKLKKTVGGEKIVAEVLTDAAGSATKVESTAAKASKAWWQLEEPKSLMDRVRQARKYQAKIPAKEMKDLYRQIPYRARQKLKAQPPLIRERIERSLYHFSKSKTVRDGETRLGAAYFRDHSEHLSGYIDEASRTLKDIQNGKSIEMYSTAPKDYAAFGKEYDSTFKGSVYHGFIREDWGSGSRFGSGKYLASNEKTSLKEVFLGRLQPDGTVKAAKNAREYSVMKVSFKPTFKDNNFLIYPSFANPGGGICIVDLEHVDWVATETAGLVRTLKEIP